MIGILALWACKSRREGGGEGFNNKTEGLPGSSPTSYPLQVFLPSSHLHFFFAPPPPPHLLQLPTNYSICKYKCDDYPVQQLTLFANFLPVSFLAARGHWSATRDMCEEHAISWILLWLAPGNRSRPVLPTLPIIFWPD